jgi:hypothetical protein
MKKTPLKNPEVFGLGVVSGKKAVMPEAEVPRPYL